MSQLEDMRILVEVADRGSFSAAAARLGLTKQLVSRRIMAMEERLGVGLLIRTTRRLSITDLGQDYVERARRIIADVDEADQAMASFTTTPKGTLRLSAPLSFGVSHLAPLFARFLTLHPGVRLELDMTDRAVDLVAEGYDAAVRIGTLIDSSLIARRLASIDMVICGAPAYLERAGEPVTIKQLQAHNCMEYRHSKGSTWPLAVAGRTTMVPVRGSYAANNGDALRAATLAGLGLAQLPTFIIGDDIAAGRVRTVMDSFAPPRSGAFIVQPAHRQRSRLVKALGDFLAVGLGEAPPAPGS